jgi:hypothetical protein
MAAKASSGDRDSLVVRGRVLGHSRLRNQIPVDGGGSRWNSNDSMSVSTCIGGGR